MKYLTKSLLIPLIAVSAPVLAGAPEGKIGYETTATDPSQPTIEDVYFENHRFFMSGEDNGDEILFAFEKEEETWTFDLAFQEAWWLGRFLALTGNAGVAYTENSLTEYSQFNYSYGGGAIIRPFSRLDLSASATTYAQEVTYGEYSAGTTTRTHGDVNAELELFSGLSFNAGALLTDITEDEPGTLYQAGVDISFLPVINLEALSLFEEDSAGELVPVQYKVRAEAEISSLEISFEVKQNEGEETPFESTLGFALVM